MKHIHVVSKAWPATAQTPLDWRLVLDWWLYGLDYKLFFLQVIGNLTAKLA